MYRNLINPEKTRLSTPFASFTFVDLIIEYLVSASCLMVDWAVQNSEKSSWISPILYTVLDNVSLHSSKQFVESKKQISENPPVWNWQVKIVSISRIYEGMIQCFLH